MIVFFFWYFEYPALLKLQESSIFIGMIINPGLVSRKILSAAK